MLAVSNASDVDAEHQAEVQFVAGGVTVLASVAALLWGRQELARAISPAVAVFLDILYFAAVGVGAILVGRRYGVAWARRAGLALAIYAAFKALYQTADLANVGLRIGACVLVGSFLLGVAFWYRGANADAGATVPASGYGTGHSL
jgi:hypothetical protein